MAKLVGRERWWSQRCRRTSTIDRLGQHRALQLPAHCSHPALVQRFQEKPNRLTSRTSRSFPVDDDFSADATARRSPSIAHLRLGPRILLVPVLHLFERLAHSDRRPASSSPHSLPARRVCRLPLSAASVQTRTYVPCRRPRTSRRPAVRSNDRRAVSPSASGRHRRTADTGRHPLLFAYVLLGGPRSDHFVRVSLLQR